MLSKSRLTIQRQRQSLEQALERCAISLLFVEAQECFAFFLSSVELARRGLLAVEEEEEVVVEQLVRCVSLWWSPCSGDGLRRRKREWIGELRPPGLLLEPIGQEVRRLEVQRMVERWQLAVELELERELLYRSKHISNDIKV
jgi:hypothetical protein